MQCACSIGLRSQRLSPAGTHRSEWPLRIRLRNAQAGLVRGVLGGDVPAWWWCMMVGGFPEQLFVCLDLMRVLLLDVGWASRAVVRLSWPHAGVVA